MNKQLTFFDESRKTYQKLGIRFVHQYAKEHGEVCADDVHNNLPPPNYIHPGVIGSFFKGMEFVRYKKSVRKECHFRVIGVWRNPAEN